MAHAIVTPMDEKTTMELKRRTKHRLAHVRDTVHATSLDGALERLLNRFELDEIYTAERAARLAEADDPAARAEMDLWEDTIGDGIE